MNTILWLDDTRNPEEQKWREHIPIKGKVIWVKNYDEFDAYLKSNDMPDCICFDHDLGLGKNGMDAAKLLTKICMKKRMQLPKWVIQSANPIGSMNIYSYLKMFEKVWEPDYC